MTFLLWFFGTLYLFIGFMTSLVQNRWRYILLWPTLLIHEITHEIRETFPRKW